MDYLIRLDELIEESRKEQLENCLDAERVPESTERSLSTS